MFYLKQSNGNLIFNSEGFPLENIFKSIPNQLEANSSLSYEISCAYFNVEKLSEKKSFTKDIYHGKLEGGGSNLLKYDLDEIDSLKRCVKCILPESFPFISFDDKGVCNFCNEYKPLKKEGSEIEKQISCSKNVILALSGGRDSCYGLHKLVHDYGKKPITFTYDWGMITESARVNIAKITSYLGVRNIVVGADTRNKRKHIQKNVLAWLKKPEIGMVPLFMAGDKHFFKYMKQVNKENNIDTEIWCSCPYESTFYRTGYTGVKPNFKSNTHLDDINTFGKLQLLWYYFKNTIKNPSYINESLKDSLTGFWSYYFSQNINQILLYKYVDWDEKTIDDTLLNEYGWELSPGFKTTWRSGDGTAAFYNYINLFLTGFTENDALRSNLIRAGKISREDAISKVIVENEPNYEMIKWYLDAIDLDFNSTIKRINSLKTLYENH